jgi:glutaredoxin
MYIEVISKDMCVQCNTAKSLLKSKCLDFEEKILGKDLTIQDLHQRITELKSIKPLKSAPQIIVNNNHIGDLNDLIEWLKVQDGQCA